MTATQRTDSRGGSVRPALGTTAVVLEGRHAGLIGRLGEFDGCQYEFFADGNFDLWFCPNNLSVDLVSRTPIVPKEERKQTQLFKPGDRMRVICPYNARAKDVGTVVECTSIVRVVWDSDGKQILYDLDELAIAVPRT